MIGRAFGHYRVEAELGRGGMGEVYRARDTRLNRDVAIKLLPEEFARDRERLVRFEREAQVLASLNHPHIASIYGLEESASEAGEPVRFLVLELVPGETLEERIGRGPVPVEEALTLARQIAEGLEAAHEKGIIHRDLKPANIKVTPEGSVKVLDFGLAKAFGPEGGAGGGSGGPAGRAGDEPGAAVSHSPTLSLQATARGVILGTAGYMSPEQARGKPVDRRADIWAFGCVLYEMLTGRRAFTGETISDTLAAVLRADPDWSALPADAPPAIRVLLRRCLQKDMQKRAQHIGDVRIEVDEALAGPALESDRNPAAARAAGKLRGVGAPAEAGGTPGTVSAGWRVTAVAALAAALVAGAAAWRLARAPRPEPRPVRRFAIALPENAPLVIRTFGQQMALSPDGSRLVYVGPNGGSTQLYLRRLDRLEVDAIPGTEGATGPFFSPDGEWVGFFAEQKLKKISVRGGAAVTLAEASISLRASWGPDGMIVYTPGVASGLWQVSASGGAPQALTALDSAKGETSHLAPWILPDGKSVLFCNEMAGKGTSSVAIQSLETGERRTLIEGGCQAWYVPSGHLLYFLKDSFRAVPFDPLRLEPNGTDTTVLEGIGMGGAPQFSVSADGTLVYASGTGYLAQQSLVWTGRRGAATPLGPPPGRYLEPRLSPDARRVALRIISADDDIWIYELARGTQTRLTFEGENWDPVWSPDGKRIAFCSSRQGPANLYSVPADGSGALERLTTSEREQFPTSFSPDGKILAYTEIDPKTGMDIWMLPLGGKREPRPFLRTAFSEHAPAFSPDGRWIAYVSNESRRDEVYVQPHPASGRKWQVSVEGGREPVWARSGRDLFFRSGDRMMAVAVQTHPEFTAGQPVALFAGRYARSDPFSVPGYDVALDGQRFLMVKESEQGTVHTHVNVVLNWFEELRQRVPPGGR